MSSPSLNNRFFFPFFIVVLVVVIFTTLVVLPNINYSCNLHVFVMLRIKISPTNQPKISALDKEYIEIRFSPISCACCGPMRATELMPINTFNLRAFGCVSVYCSNCIKSKMIKHKMIKAIWLRVPNSDFNWLAQNFILLRSKTSVVWCTCTNRYHYYHLELLSFMNMF